MWVRFCTTDNFLRLQLYMAKMVAPCPLCAWPAYCWYSIVGTEGVLDNLRINVKGSNPNPKYMGLYVITPDSNSMMNAASATDQALSALVHHTLSSVLGHSRLSASAVLQRYDLQKPRLRVRSQLTNLQRHMTEEPLPPASISCKELKLTALVISHAILNPWEDVTEWDIDQFAEPMKNVIDKTKYFPHPQWGHISDPATILDVHGRVLEYFWRLIDPQRLEDQVYESSSLKKPAVRQWLTDITYAEDFWNTIAEIVLPDLAQVGKEAISAKQHWVTTQPPCPVRWPSIYLGIDVIVNQETPPHQDQASEPSLLDLVPGTMVFLAGKLLTHSVPKWEKGERIALAHYMKDAIHNRFGLARPMFTQQKDLLGVFLQN
ncbi:hypothetical protein EDC04DRAFT_2598503 [Pisolithus marmoratus]|nr:hypothetical protein EDC04DRAFT_2598503 [Pisolithus marmoratus]